MQFRKLRSRCGGNEATINVPRNLLRIEGLVDEDGQIREKEIGIEHDIQNGRIEIVLDPDIETSRRAAPADD